MSFSYVNCQQIFDLKSLEGHQCRPMNNIHESRITEDIITHYHHEKRMFQLIVTGRDLS